MYGLYFIVIDMQSIGNVTNGYMYEKGMKVKVAMVLLKRIIIIKESN